MRIECAMVTQSWLTAFSIEQEVVTGERAESHDDITGRNGVRVFEDLLLGPFIKHPAIKKIFNPVSLGLHGIGI